jgi:hypothetical protein
MSEPDALTGVVMPPDDQDREERIYERARNATIQALELTREQLRDLRKQREDLNAEIKLLVDEEELLARMARIKRRTHS